MCRILLAIHPQASGKLITHALHHDTGEVGTGDVPSPVKRDNPAVGAAFDREELSVYRRMTIPWGLPILHPLDERERWVLKLADTMELWEFGMQEEAMGNRLAQLVTDRARRWTEEALEGREDEPIVSAAREYIRRREQAWQK